MTWTANGLSAPVSMTSTGESSPRITSARVTQWQMAPFNGLADSLWYALMGILILLPSVTFATSYSYDSTQAGHMLWADQSESQAHNLALSTHYDVFVAGSIAHIVLKQTFHNPSTDWRKGIYVYPMSDGASVHRLVVTMDNRQIVAKIKEKSEAKRVFTEAKQKGHSAALLEQHSGDVFRQTIANIAPGESITVELHLQLLADYQHPTYSFSLPTTITPRFRPIELGSFPSDSIVDQASVTTAIDHDFTISITLDGNTPASVISSHSHTLQTYFDGVNYQITTQSPKIKMDRDFHLAWALPQGAEPISAMITDYVDDEHYGLLMITPPTAATAPVAQDITFVIDTSGSMGGESITQAKQAIRHALTQLSPDDRFNIIEFNDDYRALFANTHAATPSAMTTANLFVDGLSAQGGTQMMPALMAALDTPETHSNALRQIVFITDGAVSYEAEMLSLLERQLGNARLFTVGIGSAPNGFFMRKSAQIGRGSYIKIGDINHVADAMNQLFGQLNHGVLTDIEINWPSQVEAWPQVNPDLYLNQPIIMAIKFKQSEAPQGTISIHGFYGDGTLWQSNLVLDRISRPTAHSGSIARQWAKQKISALLDQSYTGVSDDAIKSAVLPIALKHQLLTPYTSFVAIDQVIRRPHSDPVKPTTIPLPYPAGQISIPAPQTANGSVPLIISGGFLLLLALFLRRRSRP